MRIEDELAAWFLKNDWEWHLKGDRTIVPGPEEIEQALDEAARVLYTEPVGTQLEVGRLIVKKLHRGHDVYVYVGDYE